MAPSGYFKAYVRCPFYKYDDGRSRVTCEGLIDSSSIALIFQVREDYSMQMSVFCCDSYQKCEIYRILMDKYEEDYG